MTDEQLSEVEEFVDMACREVVAAGFRISNYSDLCGLILLGMRSAVLPGQCCCPMQAVALSLGLWCAMDAEAALDLAWFGDGYDGSTDDDEGTNQESYQMGERFRARVVAGEYAQ